MFALLYDKVERPGWLALVLGAGLSVAALPQAKRISWVGKGRTVLSEGIRGVLLLLPMLALALAWQLLGLPEPSAAPLEAEYISALTLVGMSSFFAFFEEVVFRGVLLEDLRARGSDLTAVVVSSVLFGAIHAFISLSLASLVFYSLIGIILASLALNRGGILAGTVLHLIWNVGMTLLTLALLSQ